MRDSTQIYWIHKMYGWVGTYRPPCRASGGLLCHLQKTIKHESSERQTCITNFNTSLVKDIDELKQEVKELKRDVEESFLVDVNSDPQKVTDLLSSLAVRLEQITGQASQYKQYQRDLQVLNFREENAHNYSKNGSNENVAV
ncbi:dynein axonemal heavy chain 6-like isoform X2 [Tachypleus tridentatus]|uniref:dynein axonemal heavy chain 6-like isoform X2 n=1 Tax=Tachypleus tridentatus TaxID=6853 RepID=UPI003FCF544B